MSREKHATKLRASVEETARTFGKILPYAKPYWYLLALAFCGMALEGSVRGGQVWLVKNFVDQVIVPANRTPTIAPVYGIAVKLLWLAAAALVGGVLADYFSERVILGVLVNIRNRTCSNLLRQSMSFFNKQKTGELISRLTNDTGQLRRAIESILQEWFKELFEITAVLVVAVKMGGWMALTFFIAVPLIASPLIAIGKRIRKYSSQALDTLADVVQAMHQMFTGVRVVKAFKMEQREDEEFESLGRRFIRRSLKTVLATSFMHGGLQAFYNCAMAGLMIWGTYNVVHGIVTVGEFSGLMGAAVTMVKPLKTLSRIYTRIQQCLPGVSNIFRLAELQPDLTDAPNARHIEKLTSSIRLEDVSFAYGTDPVLKNINLDVAAGQMVALVGPTGAGKSTLLDLVAGFYLPTRGRITFDGQDLRTLTHDSIMELIAIVSQEPFLFHTSIRDNIRYGRLGATEGEIANAAKAAQIHDFVTTLPDGYSTTIGERGTTISGGQRQRITIARAILKNASILLLDEATSSLDTETERQVQAALAELMKGKTTFVIAHRLSTITHADLIVVLDDGRIVQKGTHRELLAQEGLYRKLHDMQFAAGEAEREDAGAQASTNER